jgi:hypothetical protein
LARPFGVTPEFTTTLVGQSATNRTRLNCFLPHLRFRTRPKLARQIAVDQKYRVKRLLR